MLQITKGPCHLPLTNVVRWGILWRSLWLDKHSQSSKQIHKYITTATFPHREINLPYRCRARCIPKEPHWVFTGACPYPTNCTGDRLLRRRRNHHKYVTQAGYTTSPCHIRICFSISTSVNIADTGKHCLLIRTCKPNKCSNCEHWIQNAYTYIVQVVKCWFVPLVTFYGGLILTTVNALLLR